MPWAVAAEKDEEVGLLCAICCQEDFDAEQDAGSLVVLGG